MVLDDMRGLYNWDIYLVIVLPPNKVTAARWQLLLVDPFQWWRLVASRTFINAISPTASIELKRTKRTFSYRMNVHIFIRSSVRNYIWFFFFSYFYSDKAIPTLESVVSDDDSKLESLIEQQYLAECETYAERNDTFRECNPPSTCHEFFTARMFLCHLGLLSKFRSNSSDSTKQVRWSSALRIFVT